MNSEDLEKKWKNGLFAVEIFLAQISKMYLLSPQIRKKCGR